MRKVWWLAVLTLTLAILPGIAAAEEGRASVDAEDRAVEYAEDHQVKVYIDGEQADFAADPLIDSGTTLVPFRGVFERIGLAVEWDDSEKKVTGTRRGTSVQLAIGSRTAVVNGKIKELEVPPKLINGFTYVPLRLVGEASDYQVDWIAETQTVKLEPTLTSLIQKGLNFSFVKAETLDGKQVDRGWTGRGRLKAGTSTLYEGDLYNGEPHGQGKYFSEKNVLYEGQWRNSRFDGQGKLYENKGLQYEGDFREGFKNGKGKDYDENGKLVYEGEFIRGVQQGTGAIYDEEGNRLFEGQVEDGIPQGQGTLYNKDGNVIYQGGFINGEIEGNGKLYTSEGTLVYEGVFLQGKPVNSFASFLTGQLSKAHSWKSFQTKHFRVFYYTDETQVKSAAEKFDGIYDVQYGIFGHRPKLENGTDLVPVYVVTPDDLKNILEIEDERLAGMWYETVMLINSKVLASSSSHSVYQTFQHELVHAMTIGSDGYQAKELPGWFIEGAATFHEYDPPYAVKDNEREQLMKEMVRTNELLSWDSLSEGSRDWDGDHLLEGYAESRSIWGYLAKTYGEDALNQIFYKEGDFTIVLEKITHKPLKELEQDWRDYVQGSQIE